MNPGLHAAWNATVAAAPDAPALIDAATGAQYSRAQLAERAHAWRQAHGAAVAGSRVPRAHTPPPPSSCHTTPR